MPKNVLHIRNIDKCYYHEHWISLTDDYIFTISSKYLICIKGFTEYIVENNILKIQLKFKNLTVY